LPMPYPTPRFCLLCVIVCIAACPWSMPLGHGLAIMGGLLKRQHAPTKLIGGLNPLFT